MLLSKKQYMKRVIGRPKGGREYPVEIIKILSGKALLNTSQIAEKLNIANSTAKNYLKILKSLKTVDNHIKGNQILWFLSPEEAPYYKSQTLVFPFEELIKGRNTEKPLMKIPKELEKDFEGAERIVIEKEEKITSGGKKIKIRLIPLKEGEVYDEE